MAQSENNIGTGMAAQSATLDSSVRQPSVSYQAAVRMPDAPLENRVKEPKTDWVNYALEEGSRAVNAYSKVSAESARAEATRNAEALKKQEEEAKMNAKNELARRVLQIDERLRQKGYSTSSEAVTEIRKLQDEALASGILTDKEIYDITQHYAKPTMSLGESLQQAEQTFDREQEEKKVTRFITEHPAYTGASKATVLGIIDKADNALSQMTKLINERDMFKPGTDEYKVKDAALAQRMKESIELNLCVHLADLVEDTPITPQTLQQIKTDGMKYYTSLGGNGEMAGILIDRFFDQSGATYLQDQYIKTNKISKEALKDALETFDLQAEYKLSIGIPGYSLVKKASSQYLGQLMAEEFAALGITENIAQGISLSSGLIKVVKDAEGKSRIVSALTPEMIKGLNNLQADGSTTPYMRGVYGLGTLTLINGNNKVTYKTADGDVKVALNNFDGTFSRLNLSALKRDAKRLLASGDAESEEVGQKIEEETSKFEGNKITAEILGRPSVVKQAFQGLQDSLNASELRYDKDGKLFLSGTSGILGGISGLFTMYNGEGSYKQQIDTINAGLDMYTNDVEAKKQVLVNMGATPMKPGDFDVVSLGTREGQKAYVQQRSERSEGGFQRAVNGVGNRIADWFKSDNGATRSSRNIFNIDRPATTTSRLTSSSSQVFNTSQPFIYKGNINLDERPMYDNEDGSISTEESITVEHDGKFYVIPTIRTEDGKRIDMTDDEADRYFLETGEHLGEYNSQEEADEAAEIIHSRFENPGIMYDPVNNRMVDPRDLRQDFGDTAVSRGQTPSRLEDYHKDLLISQETLGKKPDLKVYKDSLKHDTIGYGHKLTDAEKASGKFKKGITEEEAWELFEKDYAQAVKDVDSILKEKGIDYIPEEARLVLVNMAYNMGKGYVTEDGKKHKGLKSFVKMFEGIKEGDVNKIVKEMIDSKWYKQVTNRANTLIEHMIQAYK